MVILGGWVFLMSEVPLYLEGGVGLVDDIDHIFSKSNTCKRPERAQNEPQIRARLGTTAHFCRVAVLKLRIGHLQREGEPERGHNAGDVGAVLGVPRS